MTELRPLVSKHFQELLQLGLNWQQITRRKVGQQPANETNQNNKKKDNKEAHRPVHHETELAKRSSSFDEKKIMYRTISFAYL